MKKIIFAAICLLSFRLTAAAYNTYAPNFWDIVKKEAWDYQAVYDLCEKGRAPDYDRNFFNRGSLTRYELASVLKNILEAEKKGAAFTEEEKKKLIRLKKEYARELDALGYRDEKGKKEPVIEIEGDARVRWTKGEENDARIRTGAKWTIGNSTYIQGQGSINL